MKMYTIKIEIVDEANELIAHVETFDEVTASVDITSRLFSAESWKEFAKMVEQAIDKLELEQDGIQAVTRS